MKFITIAGGALLCCAFSAQAAEPPRTLFEMAGVRQRAGNLSNSVLIIIDAQREYVDGALPLPGVGTAIAEIGNLLARARKAGTPVVHVVHYGKGGLFNPDGRGFTSIAALKPQQDENVVEKMQVSAFAGTRLEEILQQTGRKNLIIVGFMTHNCVSSTARTARDMGYAPTIVAAATATRDLPDGKGGIVPASVLQAASLAELADRIAVIAQREDDIRD